MPKYSETTREERLERISRLLQRNPGGLSEREIAEALNFERRTTHNYLKELDLRGKADRDGQLWFPLPHHALVLRNFELQPEEAVILYLAARLFVKQSDTRHELAEHVLTKLADILSTDIGLSADILRAAQELAHRPFTPGYEDIFRTVARAYIYRRQVEIAYQPYRGKPFKTVLSPYLLEPSAIGFATYVIGHSSIVNAIRTYKLERIEQARLLRDQEYTVPDDFPGLELLRNAWSIYYGDAMVHVTLRFHPDVAKRVQETNWHPSQRLEWDEQRPGYLLVALDVADTTDLKPWIRAWGANCEVLEPVDLRDEMIGEARRLAYLYGWRTARSSDGDVHSRFGDIFGE